MVVNLIFTHKNPRGTAKGIFYLRLFIIIILPLRASAQPKLEVKDAKINFGFVKQGKIVENVYEISNVGNQPLLINDAEVSCSCTTVNYPKQPLLPSQTATIIVIFDTNAAYGRQDRTVYLHSNDPRGPRGLRYKGVVVKK